MQFRGDIYDVISLHVNILNYYKLKDSKLAIPWFVKHQIINYSSDFQKKADHKWTCYFSSAEARPKQDQLKIY